MVIRKEFIIGLLSVIGIVILYWGTKFLKGNNVFSSSDTFHVVYNEIAGVQIGRPVTLNGYKVGQVNNIKLLNSSTNPKVLVSFALEEEMPIPSNSIARIYDMDIMGAKGIQLDLGDAGTMLSEGDTLISSVAPGLVKDMMSKIEPFIEDEMKEITAKVSDALDNFNELSSTLNEEIDRNKSSLSEGINNFKTLSADMVSVLDSVKVTLATFNRVGNEIEGVDMQKLSNEMELLLSQANVTLAAINSDQGSIGKMLHDKALYNDLQSSVNEMELLLKDMREHPKRYVHFSIFGRKDKEVTK